MVGMGTMWLSEEGVVVVVGMAEGVVVESREVVVVWRGRGRWWEGRVFRCLVSLMEQRHW